MGTQTKAASQSRWRSDRISLRMHPDLKQALEFLAEADRRTLSQYIELICLDHVKVSLRNEFCADGSMESGQRKDFVLRDQRRR
jgi:hypothetical protein